MIRFPIIRHIRWFYLRFRLNSYVISNGYPCASQSDINYLKDVYAGVK
jgi:hypothetical protein